MDFVDVSEHAHGFIAIGQEARGIIAIGQVATGVIAIGQGAHGIIAIGQLAVGLVGWGQLGLGIFSAAGMVGAGGRRMLGVVVPLVPSIGRPVILPEAAPLNAVLASRTPVRVRGAARARRIMGGVCVGVISEAGA